MPQSAVASQIPQSRSEDSRSRDPLTYGIIGCAMKVHRHFGPGFQEYVYQEALALELAASGLPFEREATLPIHYQGIPLACKYRADFVVDGKVLLELKALAEIPYPGRVQLLNYLRVGPFRKGLLINFGAASLEVQRFVV